ncbi:hypothetical protein EYB31_27070 [Paenibacillus thalictri]|uniref:TAXI family TRAP transporter solute-binding subunit n=1 Tax=Paenibacillus thalictri TaxID=2527873 RepID=A0A4Q9DMF4_9BACL|nr:hypothetical protein EYB31_27070 [Paenibacillus thalictri]
MDVKISAPGLNWIRLASLLAIGMDGYYSSLPKGSTVSVITGNPGTRCVRAPELVANGDVHMAITTPSWYAKIAAEGKGPYSGNPLPLRALAAFPHDDRLVMAVRQEVPIHSLHELQEKKLPLHISMPVKEIEHPAGWVVEAVLEQYGLSLEDIESWGGKVLKDRPRFQNSPTSIPVDPSFSAVFDEAIMTRRWPKIANQYPLRYLPLDENVVAHFEEMGMARGFLEKGRLPGVQEDVLTIDFSGWLLFCREDMPFELGYLAARALDEQHEAINAIFAGEFAPMTSPIRMHEIGRNTPIPLHAGAEAYYKEKGYL